MKEMTENLIEFFPELQQIQDENLREKVVLVWQEVFQKSSWKMLQDAPFNFRPGSITLVEHTRAVLDIALKIADTMERVHRLEKNVNRDLLIAACALHDVDKLLAYAPGDSGQVLITDVGLDFQHGFYSAYYAEKHELPPEVVTMLIDHTDYSRVAPDSIEGMILIMADLSDAELLSVSNGSESSLMKKLGKESNRQKMKKILGGK